MGAQRFHPRTNGCVLGPSSTERHILQRLKWARSRSRDAPNAHADNLDGLELSARLGRMPFDAGPRRPEPAPGHPADEPIDWLDWGLRIIVFGSLLVLWTVWAATSIWSAVAQGWGLS